MESKAIFRCNFHIIIMLNVKYNSYHVKYLLKQLHIIHIRGLEKIHQNNNSITFLSVILRQLALM